MKLIRRPPMPPVSDRELAKSVITDAYPKKVVGGAPVAFSASAALTPGKTTTLNAQTLQSGFRTPYIIDEIRVSAQTVYEANAPTVYPASLTGLTAALRFLFQTGQYAFSQDAVPCGLLAPVFSPNDYGLTSYGVNAGAQARWANFASVRWLLPKPLFMPAGDSVLANVEFNDDAGVFAGAAADNGGATSITVTYIGRIVPQGYQPKTREVPWLAWWSKRLSTSWATSQTRFRNPFQNPVHVQRFTSRTYKEVIAPGTPTLSDQGNVAQFDDTALGGSGTYGYHEVTMDDSRGYSIVPRYAPIGEVFDASRRAWTFGRELSPREQFNIQMRTTAGALALPANTDYLTNIGVVGYRSEAL